MILLDTITRNLELKLGGAITTNELVWVCSYVEFQGSPRVMNPFNQNGVSTGTTAISIMDAPGEDADTRQLKALSVCNIDTVDATVIIQYDDNATIRQIIKVTLNSGDELQYIDTDGFRVFDSYGRIKSNNKVQYYADGQLPNAKGTLFTATVPCKIIGITLVSSDGVSYNCNIYVNRTGTSRRIIPLNKPVIDDLQYPFVANIQHGLDTGDLIEGDANTASKVDYLITVESL